MSFSQGEVDRLFEISFSKPCLHASFTTNYKFADRVLEWLDQLRMPLNSCGSQEDYDETLFCEVLRAIIPSKDPAYSDSVISVTMSVRTRSP